MNRVILYILISFVVTTNAFWKDFLERRQGDDNNDNSVESRARRLHIAGFNRTNITHIHGKLEKIRQRWAGKMKLNATQQAELNELMKKIRVKKWEKLGEHGNNLQEVNQNANLTEFMYQGDIVLTVKQADAMDDAAEGRRDKRQAYRDRFYPNTIWGTTVYYYYDPTATTAIRNVVEKAVALWQANTCINFVQSSTAANRIRIFKGQGCYSYIGKIGGVQELSLGSGCESIGTAAHELGHALGYFHEQSRYDRDSFITVNPNNIRADFLDQFDKETTATNYNYGMTYDYGSVMHYGGNSASSNGQPTMVARDANHQDTMGSDFISFYDISMMNEHYSCKQRCGAGSAVCQNGGFPNPRSCSVCICPSGFGGTLCNQRPAGCGTTVTATANFQTLQMSVGTGGNTDKVDFTTCNYWVQAPAGSRVQMRMLSYSGPVSTGCAYGGVELKTVSDLKSTGYRFCSNADANILLTSTANVAPIFAYNRYGVSTIKIEYRLVSGGGTTINTGTGTTGTGTGTTTCVDATASCTGAWLANNFCGNAGYTTDIKKAYCAKTCNLC